MKTRALFLTTILITLTFTSFAQIGTFEQVSSKEVKGKLSEYVTRTDVVFRVGDTLIIGYPFRNNAFTYLINKTLANMGEIVPITLSTAGSMGVIKSMRTQQRKLYVSTYGSGESVALYITNFEEAFNTGEIILPNYLTSDEALEELKKAKDKLELELITQEEYDAIKAELIKYIK